MHEEDYGILWKHTDSAPARPKCAARAGWSSRRSRRSENYEYGFFWYLYQDGTIQFEIKLTGILSLGAHHEGETPARRQMRPRLYAPNHQHFFNVRLDIDIDGERNTVVEVDSVPDPARPGKPVRKRVPGRVDAADTRSEAQRDIELETRALLEDLQ